MVSLTGKRQRSACCLFVASVGLAGCSPPTSDVQHQATSIQPTSFEIVPADEPAWIDETVALGVSLQDKRAEHDATQKGEVLRGVHAKSHGCVKAEFAVRPDLDEKYRIGLFRHSNRVHEAWIRFSNASVLREDDLKPEKEGDPITRQNGSRGMAIKVMDVEGDMLSKDNGRSHQDFLMINTPAFAFANTRDYLRLNRILDRSEKGDDPKPYFFPAALADSKKKLAALGASTDGETADLAAARAGLGRAIAFLESEIAQNPFLNNLSDEDLGGTVASAIVAKAIALETVRNPMQVQYFGAAPFLFGDGQVMKFSAAPCTTTPQAAFANKTADNPSKDYLREALAETMQGKEDVCYDFNIQTKGADTTELNIEDATTTWPDEVASYVNVAKIMIRVPQTPHTDEALEHCEALAFNPWHSLVVHQPLGSINRLRRDVYFGSAGHRNAGF